MATHLIFISTIIIMIIVCSSKPVRVYPSKVPKFDTNIIGAYDYKVKRSIANRVCTIYSKLLSIKSIDKDIIESKLVEWSYSCLDEYGIIKEAVFDGLQYDSRKNTASRELPDIPRILLFNDRLNIKSLDNIYYQFLAQEDNNVKELDME